MPVDFLPRKLFQADPDRRAQLAVVFESHAFQEAVVHAIAYMVARGLAPDGLAGINSFLDVLLNICEDQQPARTLPIRHLASWDPPPKPGTVTGSTPPK